ncbi:hypothetical protein BK640_28620 [Pseudomonas protegens]|nr:hypothetical protein BK639_28810 [Pseudomonas protegens]ROL95065.1 hypothetical protein BK640_28620 [Pseudomonas protegens]ROL97950.1 hypothetical protein BK641_27475 [Pseudomonas protegens]ROM07736.1 hypothetical protein BK642_14375 [Pseudomonas protegens]
MIKILKIFNKIVSTLRIDLINQLKYLNIINMSIFNSRIIPIIFIRPIFRQHIFLYKNIYRNINIPSSLILLFCNRVIKIKTFTYIKFDFRCWTTITSTDN